MKTTHRTETAITGIKIRPILEVNGIWNFKEYSNIIKSYINNILTVYCEVNIILLFKWVLVILIIEPLFSNPNVCNMMETDNVRLTHIDSKFHYFVTTTVGGNLKLLFGHIVTCFWICLIKVNTGCLGLFIFILCCIYICRAA